MRKQRRTFLAGAAGLVGALSPHDAIAGLFHRRRAPACAPLASSSDRNAQCASIVQAPGGAIPKYVSGSISMSSGVQYTLTVYGDSSLEFNNLGTVVPSVVDCKNYNSSPSLVWTPVSENPIQAVLNPNPTSGSDTWMFQFDAKAAWQSRDRPESSRHHDRLDGDLTVTVTTTRNYNCIYCWTGIKVNYQ
jgi:hypothetical protein